MQAFSGTPHRSGSSFEPWSRTFALCAKALAGSTMPLWRFSATIISMIVIIGTNQSATVPRRKPAPKPSPDGGRGTACGGWGRGAGDRGRRFPPQGKRRAREGGEEKREMALFRHGSDVRSTAPRLLHPSHRRIDRMFSFGKLHRLENVFLRHRALPAATSF